MCEHRGGCGSRWTAECRPSRKARSEPRGHDPTTVAVNQSEVGETSQFTMMFDTVCDIETGRED